MLFVAAAGNDSDDTDTNPLPDLPAAFDLPNILSVAAIDNTGGIAGFSNYGKTTIDIAAPGEGILSTVPAEAGYPQGWAWMDGTSMAAPHVTGTAALVATVFPALAADPNGLKARLLATGKPDAATTGMTVTGRVVDAFKALDSHRPDRQRPVELRIHRGRDDWQLQHLDACRLGERNGRSERRGRVRAPDAHRYRTVGHGHRVDHGPEHLADPEVRARVRLPRPSA